MHPSPLNLERKAEGSREEYVMSTVFDQRIYKSFILDEGRVRTLAGILQNYAGELSISIICKDDATRSFENVDKLLEYENARSRRITSLTMSSYARSRELGTLDARIQFDCPTIGFGRWKTGHISIYVRGTEEQASITMSKLDDMVAGSHPWYSWITKINEIVLWPLFSILLLILYLQLGLISSNPPFHRIIVLMGMGFGLAQGAMYVNRSLFPVGVFLIGQEKARHKTKERVQWMVAIPLVMTVIAGVIFSIFM